MCERQGRFPAAFGFAKRGEELWEAGDVDRRCHGYAVVWLFTSTQVNPCCSSDPDLIVLNGTM